MKRTKQFELERNSSVAYGESIEELIKTKLYDLDIKTIKKQT